MKRRRSLPERGWAEEWGGLTLMMVAVRAIFLRLTAANASIATAERKRATAMKRRLRVRPFVGFSHESFSNVNEVCHISTDAQIAVVEAAPIAPLWSKTVPERATIG